MTLITSTLAYFLGSLLRTWLTRWGLVWMYPKTVGLSLGYSCLLRARGGLTRICLTLSQSSLRQGQQIRKVSLQSKDTHHLSVSGVLGLFLLAAEQQSTTNLRSLLRRRVRSPANKCWPRWPYKKRDWTHSGLSSIQKACPSSTVLQLFKVSME